MTSGDLCDNKILMMRNCHQKNSLFNSERLVLANLFFCRENLMLNAIMDRIIVRLDVVKPSAVFISDQKTAQNRGVVISVGPLVSEVKPGDHIVFHQFDELPLPEDDMVVIREKSLLGKYDQ